MYSSFDRLIETGSFEPRTRVSQVGAEIALILLICLSVLSPNLEFNDKIPLIRLDLFVLILIVVAYMWLLFAGQVGRLHLPNFLFVGALFGVSTGVSLLYGAAVLHNSVQLSDYYEMPKALMPIALFAVGYEAKLSERGVIRLTNWLAVAALIVCLLGWTQYLHLPFAGKIQAVYGDAGHNDRALLLFNRIYSTLTNPNVLGEFLSWTLVGYTLAFLSRVGNQARNVLVSFCCMVTLLLTGSRYGFLAACLGVSIALVLARRSVRGWGKVIALAAVLAGFAGVFDGIQRASYFTSQRFQELRNPLQVDSLRGRLDDLWLVASDYFLRSPILGQGPAKRMFDEAYTDSEYLDVLKKFGVVGFSIYLGFYLWPLVKIRKALRWTGRVLPSLEEILPGNLFAVRFGFAMLCMALFMNIGMYTCFNWYLMSFLWAWIGVSVRGAENTSHAVLLATAPAESVLGQGSPLSSNAYPETDASSSWEYA